jgi:hemoglobin
MLEKLGGRKVLKEAIDTFYDKQMNDVRLKKFFEHSDIEILKWHQFNLMSIAFTSVPENFDVEKLILTKHERLFDMGLNEGYYDIVMDLFKTTLEEMNVDSALIEEAMEVVLPLRRIFEKGAQDAKKRKKLFEREHRIAVGVLLAFVAFGLLSLIRGKKK